MPNLIRVSHYVNATRFSNSITGDGTFYNISFTKESSTSRLVIEGVIPTKENYNDGAFLLTAIDGVRKYTGVHETPMDSNQVQQCLVKQVWTGVSAGSKTLRFGWQELNGSGQMPWTINHPNSSDEGRNQQSGSEWLIWEWE